MAKERIYELAKELKMPRKDLVKLANDHGMAVKSHMSSVTPDQAKQLRGLMQPAAKPTPKPTPKPASTKPAAKAEQPKKAKHDGAAKGGHDKKANNGGNNGV